MSIFVDLGDNPTVGAEPNPNADIREEVMTIDSVMLAYVPVNENNQSSIFTDYIVNNRYYDNERIYMGGLTSPEGFQGQSVGFCQLSNRVALWCCDWTASRYNEMPEIPKRASNDSNWIFLFAAPETNNLLLAADGTTPLYRISGTYYYGCKNPPTEIFDLVIFPKPPWMQDQFDRTVPDSKQEDGIKDGKGGGNSQSFPGVPMNQGFIRET